MNMQLGKTILWGQRMVFPRPLSKKASAIPFMDCLSQHVFIRNARIEISGAFFTGTAEHRAVVFSRFFWYTD